jgi:hypothetical protein
MKRIAIPVGVTGNHHHGGIGHAIVDAMIRGVASKDREVVSVFRSAKFISPDMCVVK